MGTSRPRTAADIMQRDLIVVDPADSLRHAMTLMTENHVTGLPVVDSNSRCVGVVSATDILNYEHEQTEFRSEDRDETTQHYDMETQRWESVRVSHFAVDEHGEVPVTDVMSAELVSVERGTPLPDVANTMVKNGIHRVLVMGGGQRLYGIISATDFVRIFANQKSISETG